MTTVKHLLSQKPNEIWSVAPVTTLREALKLMYDRDIGVVVVMAQEQIVGIFSERDFARHAARADELSLNTPVSELMTSQIYYVEPDQFIDECMAIMTEKHIRHLPVMKDKQLVGLISIGDVVREAVSQKDVTIRSLENYIMGREFS
jgi:CBS domain-containing protein